MILDKSYWWTNDNKNKVVPDGHPDAAFLAFAKGHELADTLARNYGILKDDEDEADAKAKDEAEAKATDETAKADEDAAKAKATPADKAKAKPANKSGE